MAFGLQELLFRWKAMIHKRRLDRDLAEELAFHQAMAKEKLLRGETPPPAAEPAIRAEFGTPQSWRKQIRDAVQFPLLENLLRDVSFSARLLWKSKGFTAVALLTLALGVGANTSVFSLINALLLRPLPVPHSEQLVVLGTEADGQDRQSYGFCAPFFRSLERRQNVFENIAAVSGHTFQVRGTSGNQQLPGVMVSGQFFETLQTPPLLGRYLTPSDDVEGGGATGFGVVISESFWQSWFNRSPNVIGSKITIANAPFTVVGVMPKQFIGADSTARPDIYAPLWAEPILDAPFNMIASGYQSTWLRILARRRAGISLEQVKAALQTESNPIIDESIPDAQWIASAKRQHFRFTGKPGATGLSYFSIMFKKPLLTMFCMCGLMLLLACLNLASLLMARAATRERELATRLAIGATRRRLIQQFLIESSLIAGLGTGIGLVIAPAVSRVLLALLFGNLMTSFGSTVDTGLDVRVLLFVALIAGMATILVGLIPALRATSGNLNDQIKNGSYAMSIRERRRLLPRILLGSEVALALLLVTGAGLLATSLMRLYRAGLGFEPKGIVNVDLQMDKQSLDGDALLRWYKTFGDAISHEPGVRAVSFSYVTPLGRSSWNSGYKTAFSGGHRDIYMNAIAPDYFQTMHIPMMTGRDFRWDDSSTSRPKVILNTNAAKILFPGQNPIGQQIVGEEKKPYEVIAIVGNVKYLSIQKDDPPGAYVAITQHYAKKPSYKAVVRYDGPVAPLAGAVRSLAAQMAPDIPAPVLTTMSSQLDSSISSERMMAILSVFFAACALLVTAIGLYGTLSYATARRTSEIGIRIALGAQRLQVVGLVFRENAWIAAGGSVGALIAAFLAAKALASFLYGTSTHDPWVMLTSVFALATVASAASLIPAIRAARIEPMKAIRCE